MSSATLMVGLLLLVSSACGTGTKTRSGWSMAVAPDPMVRIAVPSIAPTAYSFSETLTRPERPSRPPEWLSKLGPHILGPPDNPGATTILKACPKVAKWLVPYPGTDLAISGFKSSCPAGIVVLRVYVPSSMASYTTANDPTVSANDFWSKMATQGLSSAGSPNQIDWLEGPNELDNLPPSWYSDPTAAEWVASFWSRLADLMHTAGYNPSVGSLVGGQPSPPTVFAPVATVMKSKAYK